MNRSWSLLLLTLALALRWSSTALGADAAISDAHRAQMETLRGEVAAQIQLQAYDLLDELVLGWTTQPVFDLETPVVLADVTVPVGFGTGLQALIENHFASLVVKNPRGRVTLAHCPACTAVVVHAGAKGTIVGRGVDQPEALSAAGGLSGSRHALFLDFEAEGAALVLRARITALTPALPIVYAKTLSTSTASPALLRSEEHLKTASEARQEYVDALSGRGSYVVPFRIAVRSYAAGRQPITVAPFAWMQAGVEGALTQARAWTGSFSAGFSWVPDLHLGWMAQARVARLLSGSVSSLTGPDLYGFFGGSVISIRGKDAAVFQDKIPSLDNLISQAAGNDPTALFGAFQFGLELRVKNRIGVGVFLESLPSLYDAPAIGQYFEFGLRFQTLGAEVSFCF